MVGYTVRSMVVTEEGKGQVRFGTEGICVPVLFSDCAYFDLGI